MTFAADRIKRITGLFFSTFLFALGIVMTIKANIGLAPWDVFHQGLAWRYGRSFGQISILVGLVLLVINFLFKERIGWGTLVNMIFVGLFIDMMTPWTFIPETHSLIAGIVYFNAGLIVISFASYFYLNAQLGAGPRDGAMTVISKITGLAAGPVRIGLESSVFLAGFLVGGPVGLGTVICALMMGIYLQGVFNLFSFDIRNVTHSFIDDDLRLMQNR